AQDTPHCTTAGTTDTRHHTRERGGKDSTVAAATQHTDTPFNSTERARDCYPAVHTDTPRQRQVDGGDNKHSDTAPAASMHHVECLYVSPLRSRWFHLFLERAGYPERMSILWAGSAPATR
ncbi:unnamed protein product, partial [Ectocarpus sp. 12 AP-2014]